MGSKSRKIGLSLFDIICCILLMTGLVFVIRKSEAPLSYAKEQLSWQEPVWKMGTLETATATAHGGTRRARIFFKAQDVILDYEVDGVTYTCENRMLKKHFEKLDDAGRPGVKTVIIRYDPSDPSHATSEKCYDFFKKEKNCYLGVKWLSILYMVYYGIYFLLAVIRTINMFLERRKEKAAVRNRQQAAARANQAAVERAKPVTKPQPSSAPKPSEKPAETGNTPVRRSADSTDPDWNDVLQNLLKEAQERKNQEAGSSDDWNKILESTAAEAKERQNQGDGSSLNSGISPKSRDIIVDGLDSLTSTDMSDIDSTVYDTEAPSDDNGTVYDGTVYDGDAPQDNGTVYDGNALQDNGTVYDGTVYDGTVYDADAPQDNGTVYDGTVYDSTFYDAGASGEFARGNTILDTYRIDSDPIEGGMGSVWKVRHTGWNVDLAVKRPKAECFETPKQKEDFIAECENWINLGIHPDIVACYYVREIDGILSIFSEWMDNGSLADRIRDRSVYAGTEREVRERILDIAIQFAEGLYYAHNSDLIHRDVKPANLLLTRDWDARVADFGIAQLGSKKNAKRAMTPEYCSPEQVAGRKLSRRTDIYSWAVSILEIYLGYKPWAHSGQLTGPLVGEACHEYFEMCTDRPIPDSLQKLLEKCMKSDVKNRPLNFGSVIKELKKIYKAEIGRDYPRPEANVSAESADNLNNRALSYMDLGRSGETETLWNRAAFLEPAHTETLFNRCLYGYRSGSMTLYEAQCFLSANWENHFNQAEPGLLLAELSLEGNDRYNAKDVLSYVRNYSTQQGELSVEAAQKLSSLESKVDGGTWHCSYQLSRVKNYKEQEQLLKAREEKLTELKGLVRKNRWDEAAQQFMVAHLYQQLGDVIYQKDWMDFYDVLSRKCMPVLVLAQWPILTVPKTRWHDRVSFSSDSRYMLCGDRLYDLESGEQIADNRNGLDELEVCLSDLSPDGSFYLRAAIGSYNFMKVDARTGEDLVVCRGHKESITALAISRDGKRLASGDRGGTFMLWDENGNLLKTEQYQYSDKEALEDIQFGYDSRQRVLRYEDNLYLSDEIEGSMRRIPYDNYLKVAVDLEYSALGMAVGRQGLYYYDLKTNENHRLNDAEAARRRGRGITTAAEVCFMHNQTFLLASDGNTLYFFDPNNNKILSAIHMGDNFCSIAASRNGKYIAAISGGKAQLWRCIYGFRYPGSHREFGADIVKACAHILCSAHPDKNVDELLAPLMEELADRGYGAVGKEEALKALRAARV